jgi:hypothetical protein
MSMAGEMAENMKKISESEMKTENERNWRIASHGEIRRNTSLSHQCISAK